MILRKGMETLQPDWIILDAASGDLALDLLADEVVDYISVDYNMPGICGLEFLAKKPSCFPNARCAMLSANVQPEALARAQEHDANFIKKPITALTIEQLNNYFNE
ncbi:MAG: response regulator transcription factor [Algicola sp.]|nr:response regulator transcription factor [Algicola sp.]